MNEGARRWPARGKAGYATNHSNSVEARLAIGARLLNVLSMRDGAAALIVASDVVDAAVPRWAPAG